MKKVYIFDVDGVLNGLHSYEADERVIGQIAALLEDGSTVAFNTGRGYTWVEKSVLSHIKARLTTIDKLDRVFVSAEMGGVTVEFKNGVEQRNPSAFSLRPEQVDQVKALFEAAGGGQGIMWWDEKVSMATIAKSPGVDLKMFADASGPLAAQIRDMFTGQHVKISHNADAIDVVTPEAGKWAGAQLIHDWLLRTPAAGDSHFVCFGDNTPDYEMARFFASEGHVVEFVFTGEVLGDITHDERVVLTKSSRPYSDGAYEFLSKVL